MNAIRNEFRAIESLTMRLHDRAASINQIGNDIAYDLAQLRERIKLAREQANSVSDFLLDLFYINCLYSLGM